MAEIANNLKRSSSNTPVPEGMDLRQIPDEMFNKNFRLTENFFQITTPEDAQKRTSELNQKLEIVEANLGREIT